MKEGHGLITHIENEIDKIARRIERMENALYSIASYRGFNDDAIQMSAVARAALDWKGYEDEG